MQNFRIRLVELLRLMSRYSINNYGAVEDVHMYVNHVISQYIQQKNQEKTKQIL